MAAQDRDRARLGALLRRILVLGTLGALACLPLPLLAGTLTPPWITAAAVSVVVPALLWIEGSLPRALLCTRAPYLESTHLLAALDSVLDDLMTVAGPIDRDAPFRMEVDLVRTRRGLLTVARAHVRISGSHFPLSPGRVQTSLARHLGQKGVARSLRVRLVHLEPFWSAQAIQMACTGTPARMSGHAHLERQARLDGEDFEAWVMDRS